MAKRHPTSSRRSTEGSGAEADDIFVAKVVEYSTWARRNTQTLILAGLVLVVLVAGVVYWVSFQEDRELQAVRQLEQIHATVNFGDPETAKAELIQFVESFGGTPYAVEARLLLAELYLESDQAAQAIEVLDEASVSRRAPLGTDLKLLLGKAYEASGQLERAGETFLEAADMARLDFQRVQALEDAARVREEAGDLQGAVELYTRILEDLEDGDARRGLYEMRRAEARSAIQG